MLELGRWIDDKPCKATPAASLRATEEQAWQILSALALGAVNLGDNSYIGTAQER